MPKKPPKSYLGKIVHVVWIDALRNDSEIGRSEAAAIRPVAVHDLGELLHEDEECIVVAAGMNQDSSGGKNYRWTVAIPTCLVRSIEEL